MKLEQFTDRSRGVLQEAEWEARHYNRSFVGAEHLLLALAKDGNGIASCVLNNFDLCMHRIRSEIERISPPAEVDESIDLEPLPLTPRVKRALRYARQEADDSFRTDIGTEHLLLGLIRELQSLGNVLLSKFRIHLSDVRAETLRLLGLSKSTIHQVAWPFVFEDTWGEEKIRLEAPSVKVLLKAIDALESSGISAAAHAITPGVVIHRHVHPSPTNAV